MIKSFLAAATLAVAACASQAIGVYWHGALMLDSSSPFRFSLLVPSENQEGSEAPVTAVTLRGADLALTVKSGDELYRAELRTGSPASQRPRLMGAGFLEEASLTGDWFGTLDTGMSKLRLVFHFSDKPSVDSVDQGVKGIPVAKVERKGESVTVEVSAVGGRFDGKISADASSITGTWSQGGGEFALILKPMKDASVAAPPKRPQNPVKPYPYKEEQVSYDNKAAGARLAATLTLPEGKGPFPAVLLVTGSGPQDRDETVANHKPFLVLADYLTRRGIAVLRADDRGIGSSTGNFAVATTADFATDAQAGIAYLRTRPEIDARRVGIAGHSEGGVVAPMVASQDPGIAFVVMLAGTGIRGDQVLASQIAAIQKASGVGEPAIEKSLDTQWKLMRLAEQETDMAQFEKKAAELLPPGQAQGAKTLTTPWFRYFLTYDPAPALAKVKCPVLAINGSKDTQVVVADNLPPIRKALAGNSKSEVVELEGLNHLFQTAKTGSPSEYAAIEETMSPVALEKIATWILRQAAR